jgi:hypothetical protein
MTKINRRRRRLLCGSALAMTLVLTAGCDAPDQKQPSEPASKTSQKETEVPAVLVGTLKMKNDNELRFLKAHDGTVSVIELGQLGTGSYARGTNARTAAELWRALAPQQPVPADVLADEEQFYERSEKTIKPMTRRTAPPVILEVTNPACSCSFSKSSGHPQGPFCVIGGHSRTTFQANDWIIGDANVCNTGEGPINVAIKYRTWFTWSNLFVSSLPAGWWAYGWHYNSTVDFDFLTDVDPSPTLWPKRASYNRVVTGGTLCVLDNSCNNDCRGC